MRRVLILALLLGTFGCRVQPATPAASSVKDSTPAAAPADATANCPCEDLQCWANASQKGAEKQVDCATDTLATVVPILGPIKDLIKTIVAAQDALGAVKSVNEVAKEVLEATERGGIYTPCVKNLAAVSGAALTLLAGFDDLNKEIEQMKPEDSISASGPLLKKMFDLMSSAVKGINSLFEAFAACETPASKAALREHSAKLAAVKSKAVGPLRALMKPLDEIGKGAAAKLAIVGTIGKCVLGIVDGATTLYKNSACLVKDFDRLAEQRAEISRALAFVGSRIYNQARFVGCNECVGKHGTFTTANTNYQICRSLCEQKVGNFVGDDQPKKKASWITSCQLPCGVARTEGIVTTYTDESICNDVKAMYYVSRTYRNLDLTGAGQGDRAQRVAETRAAVLGHLAMTEKYFDQFDNAGKGSAGNDGLISLADYKAAAGDETLPEEARLTAHFFSDSDYWFNLVDSASQEGLGDGLVARIDVGYFRDEVSEYRDESEHE